MSILWRSLIPLSAAVILCASAGCGSDETGQVGGPGTRATVLKTEAIPIGQVDTYAPLLTKGDREFSGHGPEIVILAELHVDADTVWSFVYMRAEETLKNWTTGEGWWAKKLYEAPAGWRLNRVLNPTYCQVQYTDDGHGERVDTCPVRCDPECRYGFKLMSIGDTGGDVRSFHCQ